MINKGANDLNIGLYLSCYFGHIDIINFLVKKIDNINHGLYGATKGENIEIVKLMLDIGFENLQTKDLNISLEIACENGNLDIVELLILYGADDLESGMQIACKYGHFDIVKYLTKYGLKKWNNYLVYACHSGNVELVKYLILKGANDFDAGFHAACLYNRRNIAKLIYKKINDVTFS